MTSGVMGVDVGVGLGAAVIEGAGVMVGVVSCARPEHAASASTTALPSARILRLIASRELSRLDLDRRKARLHKPRQPDVKMAVTTRRSAPKWPTFRWWTIPRSGSKARRRSTP